MGLPVGRSWRGACAEDLSQLKRWPALPGSTSGLVVVAVADGVLLRYSVPHPVNALDLLYKVRVQTVLLKPQPRPPPFFFQTLELSTWQYGSKDGFPTSCMVASMLPGYVILLIYLYTQMQGRKARCTRTRCVCTEVLGLLAAVLVQHRYADTHKTKPSIHPMPGADACLGPARISDASGLADGGKFCC